MFRSFIFQFTTLFLFCHCYSEEKRGFFADAAVLYWKAHENGLSFAVDSSSKVKNPDFEWDFGFKVGLGYRFPHDKWNVQLQWTSVQTHADNEEKEDILFPIWAKSVEIETLFAEEAKAHWRLHLGVVDLMLSKCYAVAKSLYLIPEIGLRAGSVRQKYYIEYSGGSFAGSGDEIIHMKNKYFGIGPNVGLLGQWAFPRGFSLFAQPLLSLLFGEFYLHQDEYSGKTKLLGVHDIFLSSKAVFDLKAGIRWQRCFDAALKRLTLELAWDELLFFSQNQLLHFTSETSPGIFFANQGDLYVSGIEFNLRFDF